MEKEVENEIAGNINMNQVHLEKMYYLKSIAVYHSRRMLELSGFILISTFDKIKRTLIKLPPFNFNLSHMIPRAVSMQT